MTDKDFHDEVEKIYFEGLTVVSSVLDLVISSAEDLKSKLKDQLRGVDKPEDNE